MIRGHHLCGTNECCEPFTRSPGGADRQCDNEQEARPLSQSDSSWHRNSDCSYPGKALVSWMGWKAAPCVRVRLDRPGLSLNETAWPAPVLPSEVVQLARTWKRAPCRRNVVESLTQDPELPSAEVSGNLNLET